jgi:hypothetical protein
VLLVSDSGTTAFRVDSLPSDCASHSNVSLELVRRLLRRWLCSRDLWSSVLVGHVRSIVCVHRNWQGKENVLTLSLLRQVSDQGTIWIDVHLSNEICTTSFSNALSPWAARVRAEAHSNAKIFARPSRSDLTIGVGKSVKSSCKCKASKSTDIIRLRMVY